METHPKMIVGAAPQAGGHDRSGFGRWLGAALALVMTLVLASAWLIFPYLFEGQAVLEDVSEQVVADRNAQHRTLGQVLSRYAAGPGEAETDVLFATDVYFARTSTPRAAEWYGPDTHLVFILNEGLHTGELPASLPRAMLLVDGVAHEPADIEGPLDTDHHRTTVVRFAKFDASGAPVVGDNTGEVRLEVRNGWDADDTPRQATWTLPIAYPDLQAGISSPILIMSLAAGLLSVTLTPCLLQLIVVYMANLAGLSAEQLRGAQVVPAKMRRQMLISAVAFVIGFTLFYTAAGAVIGYAGKSAQLVFSEYSRQVAFGSGVLVILMGLWTGIKARAPLVCRMPAPRFVSGSDKGGVIRSALLAAGFSLGCMVCFSGAIMATLFVYVGSLGSASTGAFILFVFSLGVAVPFLAAAVFLTRTIGVMQWISQYTPQIGLVSMVVIIGFGLILVFDQFHTVSDLIYPWLGLK